MKKLAVAIEPGFTQLSNGIIDDDRLCVIDMGLMLKLHRCVDGYDVTVQAIADKHSDPARRGTGYTALEAAMRNVVRLGYVIKIKYQNAAGRWQTVFAPFNRVGTPQHVAALLDAIDEPVTKYRVEPAWLDTREEADTKPDQAKRPGGTKPSTDPALSGSRSAGYRQEPGSIRTEHAADNTRDQTNSPSRPSPTRARADEPGTGTGEDGKQQPGEKARKPRSGAPAAPSAGMTLLTEIGRHTKALAFGGPWLTAQGRRLDDLMAAGWSTEQLRTLLTSGLPDVIERPAGFVRRRIDEIPPFPAELPSVPEQRDPNAAPWEGPRTPLADRVPSSTLAAERTVREATGRRSRNECPGVMEYCGNDVPHAGALCGPCKGGDAP